MDKKTQKKVQALLDKLRNREKQLAGARDQPDHAGQHDELLQEIAALKAEIGRLRAG